MQKIVGMTGIFRQSVSLIWFVQSRFEGDEDYKNIKTRVSEYGKSFL